MNAYEKIQQHLVGSYRYAIRFYPKDSGYRAKKLLEGTDLTSDIEKDLQSTQNMKTKNEIELENKLLKAWAETVLADTCRKEALEALEALNTRVHSGYDFNLDKDNITIKVGTVFANQLPFKRTTLPSTQTNHDT